MASANDGGPAFPEEGALAHVVLNLGETDGACNACGSETVLVTAPACWQAHDNDEFVDWTETNDELSGHYCPACCRLTAFHFNGKYGCMTLARKGTDQTNNQVVAPGGAGGM